MPCTFLPEKLDDLRKPPRTARDFEDIYRGISQLHHQYFSLTGQSTGQLHPGNIRYIRNELNDASRAAIIVDLDELDYATYEDDVVNDALRESHTDVPWKYLTASYVLHPPEGAPPNCRHLERFNLECLIYTLFWFCEPCRTTYDDCEHMGGTMAFNNKHYFENNNAPGAGWRLPLWLLLAEGLFLGRDGYDDFENEDYETLNGRLTFENVIQILDTPWLLGADSKLMKKALNTPLPFDRRTDFPDDVRDPLLDHLTQLRTLEDFKSAFLDAIESRDKFHQKTGEIHGAITPHNLAFLRPIRQDAQVTGVFVDLDHLEIDVPEDLRDGYAPAAYINERDALCLPFTAYDLIGDEVEDFEQIHYRHDLESYFYVLLWYSVCNHISESQKKMVYWALEDKYSWFGSRWNPYGPLLEDSRYRAFLTQRKKFLLSASSKFQNIQSTFSSLEDTWLKGLWKLTGDGHASLLFRSYQADYDPTTMDGHITFDTFIAALEDSEGT